MNSTPSGTIVEKLKKMDQLLINGEPWLIYHTPEHNNDDTTTLYLKSPDGVINNKIRFSNEMRVFYHPADEGWVPVVQYNTAYSPHMIETPEHVIGRARPTKNGRFEFEFPEGGELERFLARGKLRQFYLSAFINEVKE